jgi:hypothetical protein
LHQVTASFAHQPDRDHLVVDDDAAQVLGPQRDDSDGACIGRVVLAAVPDVEDPGVGGRRPVDHRLTIRDQTLRELDTHTAGSLDHPGAVRPALSQPEHVPVTGAGGGSTTKASNAC